MASGCNVYVCQASDRGTDPLAKIAPWAHLVNLVARLTLKSGMRRQLGGKSFTNPWYDWVPLMHALSMRTAGQFDVPRSWIYKGRKIGETRPSMARSPTILVAIPALRPDRLDLSVKSL